MTYRLQINAPQPASEKLLFAVGGNLHSNPQLAKVEGKSPAEFLSLRDCTNCIPASKAQGSLWKRQKKDSKKRREHFPWNIEEKLQI